nr:hypothetical protein [Tanacetum cinerariifolium]
SSGLQRFFRCAMFIYSFYLCYSLSLYPFTERYAQPYFFSCLIRQATAPVDVENWISHMEKIFDVIAPVDVENWISHMEKIFDVIGCEDAFKTRLAVYKFEGNALAWWKAYKQAKGGDAWLIMVTWAKFKKLFFLQFFPRAEQERLKGEAAAGIEEEQENNFQWGLRRSTLNNLMCMSYTDVAQVANAARNYEILHERDDDD